MINRDFLVFIILVVILTFWFNRAKIEAVNSSLNISASQVSAVFLYKGKNWEIEINVVKLL